MNLKKIADEIDRKARAEIAENERRRFLEAKLAIIKEELEGEEIELEDETATLQDEILSLNLSPLARRAVKEELTKLKMAAPGSPDYLVSYSYLTFIRQLPWDSDYPEPPTLAKAARILESQHSGLGKIKERVLDYIAVMHHTGHNLGQILLLEGPPGVGKTSLARSVAKALGRPFAKVSLGGVKDEGEIRGHRRTYIGSMPGKILSAIKQAGSSYLVILLDEIDKMGEDQNQNLSGALLEVLDKDQNKEFVDHYLAVPYDLSKVLFIATVNNSARLPAPLRDRMEAVPLTSYTDDEKLNIAKAHIVPEIRASLDLRGTQFRFDDEAILALIRGYTLEGGVRQLKRDMTTIGRKIVRQIVSRRWGIKGHIKASDLEAWLGPRRYLVQGAVSALKPGVAVGLAYTDFGGDILLIESALTPASSHKSGLTLTGSIGPVLKESAAAAVTFLKSQGQSIGIDTDLLLNKQIHIHLPDAATPKDGPSAGLAILAALTSLLQGRPLPDDVAMTGEITLRGLVLPVGGIKEKLLAALRYGKTRVLIPADNLADVLDLPKEARDRLEIIAVSHMEEALRLLGM